MHEDTQQSKEVVNGTTAKNVTLGSSSEVDMLVASIISLEPFRLFLLYKHRHLGPVKVILEVLSLFRQQLGNTHHTAGREKDKQAGASDAYQTQTPQFSKRQGIKKKKKRCQGCDNQLLHT